MAKISPVSIKYMIHATFTSEGALEKPDVIGALFGQTEGLLGADLEMRELQKEGKIGRIEVDLERSDKRTSGTIKIPTALDQSETTLIAAAIETIERIGPSDSQIEIEKIEDVRGSKRDYIIERAKKLMSGIEGSTDSREISNEIKDSTRISGITEYGNEKLPCGDLSGKEIVVVEGRADVVNLIRSGVKNVVAMNGTKLPDSVKKLSEEKEVTLFVDGDRGGKLIIQNVTDNAKIDFIAIAPDGKEVEELTGKEVLMNLRKKIPVREYFSRSRRDSRRAYSPRSSSRERHERKKEEPKEAKTVKDVNINAQDKDKLRKISRSINKTGKAVILDENLNEIKTVSSKSLRNALQRLNENPAVVVIDGTATNAAIKTSEDAKIQVLIASNFATVDTNMQLMSL